MLYMVLYTLTSLPMMPRPGTQALVVSRADKIYISALFASSFVRNNIFMSRKKNFSRNECVYPGFYAFSDNLTFEECVAVNDCLGNTAKIRGSSLLKRYGTT